MDDDSSMAAPPSDPDATTTINPTTITTMTTTTTHATPPSTSRNITTTATTGGASTPSASSTATVSTKKPSLVRRLFGRSAGKSSSGNGHSPQGGKRLAYSEGSSHVLTAEEQERKTAALLAERAREIEQAATERDEKRKNRVGDALSLMRGRLDDAGDAIRGEMHVAVQRAFWTREEALSAGGFIIVSLFFYPILHTVRHVIGDELFAEYRVVVPLMFATMILSSTWAMSRKRVRDARAAEDVINFRLEDLESKIHLCFDALIHNLEEADDTWAARMEEQNKEWEARQRELERRRPMLEPNKLPLRPPRTMHPYEAARKLKALQVGATQRARELLQQVPGPSVVFGTRNRSPSGAKSLGGTADLSDVEHHPQATKAWIKYVTEELSVERLGYMTPEEREYAKLIDANTEGKFSKLHMDLQLMVLRGFADKKDKRMAISIEGVNYITQWRAETRSDELLTFIDPKSVEFHKGWPTKLGGEDRYGHLIVYDRIETMDIDSLCVIDDKDILHYRTQQCEMLRAVKLRIEQRVGHRVAKNVYIMDLGALSLRKHFTSKVKNMLGPIFKVNGDAYPDSLWSLWLINTPLAFRVVWTFISPIIDPSTKAKIKMVGGKDSYIPAMEKCGIPISVLPKELGGEFDEIDLFGLLSDTVAANQGKGNGDGGGATEMSPPMSQIDSKGQNHHPHQE